MRTKNAAEVGKDAAVDVTMLVGPVRRMGGTTVGGKWGLRVEGSSTCTQVDRGGVSEWQQSRKRGECGSALGVSFGYGCRDGAVVSSV